MKAGDARACPGRRQAAQLCKALPILRISRVFTVLACVLFPLAMSVGLTRAKPTVKKKGEKNVLLSRRGWGEGGTAHRRADCSPPTAGSPLPVQLPCARHKVRRGPPHLLVSATRRDRNGKRSTARPPPRPERKARARARPRSVPSAWASLTIAPSAPHREASSPPVSEESSSPPQSNRQAESGRRH